LRRRQSLATIFGCRMPRGSAPSLGAEITAHEAKLRRNWQESLDG